MTHRQEGQHFLHIIPIPPDESFHRQRGPNVLGFFSREFYKLIVSGFHPAFHEK